MSQTTDTIKEELQTLRDEIRVKLHLAGMDAKDAFAELDREAEKVTREIGKASREVIADLKSRFNKLNEALR